MSKRRVTRRFDTKDVQGEDSYVILSSLKVKERRGFAAASKEKGFSMLEFGIALLKRHVIEWNWVDEDGEPLPLPSIDSNVLDDLTDPESEMLGNYLMNPDVKN